MDREHHYLLNYLDQPFRFLFLTVDEALILLVPILVGFINMWALTGLLCSVGGFLSLRLLKNRFGQGNFRCALYWHFPTSPRQMKLFIPSYLREFIG